MGDDGWVVEDDFLPAPVLLRLRREALHLWRRGGFRHAGVGRGSTFRVQPEVRNDHVHWLDPATSSGAAVELFDRMEALRQALNRELFLGLFGFEAHLAVFPPDARYRCHLDRFVNAQHRLVSAIVYLNETWDETDGGALRLYLERAEEPPYVDVLPVGGRLVCFSSGRFHHEVLPASKDRLSITGWMTSRP